jgi:hypothetical protein
VQVARGSVSAGSHSRARQLFISGREMACATLLVVLRVTVSNGWGVSGVWSSGDAILEAPSLTSRGRAMHGRSSASRSLGVVLMSFLRCPWMTPSRLPHPRARHIRRRAFQAFYGPSTGLFYRCKAAFLVAAFPFQMWGVMPCAALQIMWQV